MKPHGAAAQALPNDLDEIVASIDRRDVGKRHDAKLRLDAKRPLAVGHSDSEMPVMRMPEPTAL